MKRKFLIPIILLVVIAVVLIIYFSRRHKTGIYGSGMIEVEEILVSTKIGGQINDLRVREGDRVKANDTLVILDQKELAAQERMASAGLAVANQVLIAATAQRENLAANLERSQHLHVTNNLSDVEWENIQTQFQVAKANEDRAMASVRAAQSQLELAQTQRQNANILSPVAGVVMQKNFEVGELVFPGSSLVKIGDLKQAWLKIYVAEMDMGKLKLGSKATVLVDAYPKQKFTGIVTWVASEAEFTPKNIQVKEERAQLVFAIKISIDNQDEKLMPGMPADAQVMLNGGN